MQIFGIKINKLKYKEFLNKITIFDKQNIVFTPNPEILLYTLKDQEYKNILKKADYLTPDGTGLYLAAQILECKKKFFAFFKVPYFIFNILFRKEKLYNKFGDKICGSDLTKDLLKISEEKNIKVTIIDLYKPEDEQKVLSQKNFENNLKQKFKNLDFNYFIYKQEEKENIIKKISKNNSKILFSTLGIKKQEESILEICKKCDNIKLGLGVGSSFDYLIGFQKRAPKIFRDFGFEWLYRLITGPKKFNRLKRLYNAIVIFTFKIFINK